MAWLISFTSKMMTRRFFAIIALEFFVFAGMGYSSHALGEGKGSYRLYRFNYQDHNTTTLFPERLGQKKTQGSTFMSSFSFDGDLLVKEYGQVDNRDLAGLSFSEIRSNHLVLNGHDIFQNPSEFIESYKHKEVLVVYNDLREITAFYFPEDTSQLFKTFMTMVAQEIQVSQGQGQESWKRTEFNQHGKGPVTYHITEKDKGKTRIKKSRTRYDYPGLIEADDRQEIIEDNIITLDQQGMVESMQKKETTRIKSKDNGATVLDVKKTVSLTQTSTGAFHGGGFSNDVLSTMQRVMPGEFISDTFQESELLSKQASFLSYTDIERWIESYQPDTVDNRANNAMFYRSTGFVTLHPQSMEKLAEFAKHKTQKSQEQTLVMNLLAAVGNRNAQKAMRDILSDPVIQKKRQYGVMIQNFSFVDALPEPETLDFLETLMSQRSGFVSYSAAHAFGAMIHNVYTEGQKDRALKLNQMLVTKMETATSTKDKAEYLAALGNAGIFENNSKIFQLFHHPSSKIRSEAAMALRKTETPDSRKTLINVFADPARSVQRSAIQTSLHYSPEKKDLQTIRSHLKRGMIQEANYYDLVTLLTKNRPTSPSLTNECLKLMVKKKLSDPDLEARIRGLIHRQK